MLLLVNGYPHALWGHGHKTPSKPSNGDGVDNPYQISTAAELAWFRDQVNSGNNTISATLTDNIDLYQTSAMRRMAPRYTKKSAGLYR